MPDSDFIKISKADYEDMYLFLLAANAQDSPEPAYFYYNEIHNRLDAYKHQYPEIRQIADEYLAEKKYLPPAPPIQIAK